MMRMQTLMSPAGALALRLLMQPRPLLDFDFDGRLAPIAAHPPDARVAPRLGSRLVRQSARLPVAVVSGRAVSDLEQHLSFLPRWVQYAVEIDRDGVLVEDKGLSIALHYRCAPERTDAMSVLVRACGASCAYYIGDDANDDSVFRRAPAHWMNVRVGRDDPHSAAAWVVESETDAAHTTGLDGVRTGVRR